MGNLPPSLWASTAGPAPSCPSLRTTEASDVVVIGAGYTGLSAALHLANEGKAVHVLEAEEPGYGCSGRNGGQVNPGATRMVPDEIIGMLGRDRGNRFIKMGDETCDLVFDLIDEHDIDCDALRPGYVQGGWGRLGRRFHQTWVQQWGRHGIEVELLDRTGLRELIGSEAYEGGLYDPRGGNLQPLAYARGLANAAIAAGVNIHGQSRAISVERDGAGWQVDTASGCVKAEHLLIGTNGYTDGLWPGLAQTVVPVSSFLAASAPLSHNMLATILPGKHAVSESCRIIVYYRLDRDGRFVIGGRGNLLDTTDHGDDAHIRQTAVKLFPQLADVEWEYQWGGWPAITQNHLPMLTGLGANAYAGLGYNGRGVAMATMMGKQLSMAVLGEDPHLEIKPLKRYAFHALRQVGISYRLLSNTVLDKVDRAARA